MVKLTQYSHGAGCGCKIAPNVLNEILKTSSSMQDDKRLIVGNKDRDDAAVYDMGNETAIISTTDFFMPIVDDPFTFGKIAAVNAISDVYAMGGTPLLAIAILGWPMEKLPPEVAQQVLEGGRSACKEAGISLAGGHSIDSPEPIFGLAVTGSVKIPNLKTNNRAEKDCRLYLTKPLGVGILTTAQKKGLLQSDHANIAPESMSTLNKIGEELGTIPGVMAMTDVTGFGLLGHLKEMCEGSNLSASIEFSKIPVLQHLDVYLEQGCIPGGTNRNWESFGKQIKLSHERQKHLLCDPQTSGGLLIAVADDAISDVERLLEKNNSTIQSFGVMTERKKHLIEVI